MKFFFFFCFFQIRNCSDLFCLQDSVFYCLPSGFCLLYFVIHVECRFLSYIIIFCFRLRCTYICLLFPFFSFVCCFLYFAISFRCNLFYVYYFLIFIFRIMSSGFCLIFLFPNFCIVMFSFSFVFRIPSPAFQWFLSFVFSRQVSISTLLHSIFYLLSYISRFLTFYFSVICVLLIDL